MHETTADEAPDRRLPHPARRAATHHSTDRTSVRKGTQHGRFARMTDDLSRILAPDLLDDTDVVVEGTLRPRTLDEYIGQREVKANLSVLLAAARGREEAADHVLLYGPPGLGKTTLATIIARELGVNVRYTSGPAVERAGDLAAILTALDERDVLFIDEIHRLNRSVEEILYPAMEDYALDVMIGKGPSARSLRLSLKPFTVVGATTRAGRISGPLRDRFGATYRLDFYEEDDLAAIVDRSARILDVAIDDAAARAIARRGRGTPRIVNRLLKRTRDHAQVHGNGRVDEATATAAMRQMEIDDEGLDSTDRKLLAAIIQKFASGPVGVQALAAVLAEEVETIEDVYEPFLLRLGFLDRTPQGRIATEAARNHLARLGYEIPPPRRSEPELVGLWDPPVSADAPKSTDIEPPEA
jgi:holliday junction DNA helicase RuvB